MAKRSTGRRASTGTPALALLTREGVDHVVHTYDHDPTAHDRGLGFGQEAAAHLTEVLGIAPERIFKTLLAEVDGDLTVAVVPVTGQLNLKALAHAVEGKRAVMAQVAVAERATGYVAGGISPLGQRRNHRTVVDSSAIDHDSVLVSGGRRGLDIELAARDLVRLTTATVAPIGLPE